jgi:hypothetical protein
MFCTEDAFFLGAVVILLRELGLKYIDYVMFW